MNLGERSRDETWLDFEFFSKVVLVVFFDRLDICYKRKRGVMNDYNNFV